MSKIVDTYIELDNMFNKCTENQFEEEYTSEDMKLYATKLDSFVAAAKECYFKEDLDINTAINLFNNDSAAKEELDNRLSEQKNNKVK